MTREEQLLDFKQRVHEATERLNDLLDEAKNIHHVEYELTIDKYTGDTRTFLRPITLWRRL